MILTLPIPGFISVVGLAILRLPGDGIQFAPGLPTGLINLALFFFGKLLVGGEFLHTDFLLVWFLKSVYHNWVQMHKRFVNPSYDTFECFKFEYDSCGLKIP